MEELNILSMTFKEPENIELTPPHVDASWDCRAAASARREVILALEGAKHDVEAKEELEALVWNQWFIISDSRL